MVIEYGTAKTKTKIKDLCIGLDLWLLSAPKGIQNAHGIAQNNLRSTVLLNSLY